MSKHFIARNLLYYPGFSSDNCQELSDEIIIPTYYLNTLMDSFDEHEPLLLTLTNIRKNMSTVVSIGGPHKKDKNTLLVPQWILDLIDHTGELDDIVTIEKVGMDIPIATKIIIKPLEPIAFEIDTLAYFEKSMMNLHTIKEGIIIPIAVPEFGSDFNMLAYIEKVEPAALSRIIEGEVQVEFINEFIQSASANSIKSTNSTSIHVPQTGGSSDNNFDSVFPIGVPQNHVITSQPHVEPCTNEQRKQMRESRLKRFENNVKSQ